MKEKELEQKPKDQMVEQKSFWGEDLFKRDSGGCPNC